MPLDGRPCILDSPRKKQENEEFISVLLAQQSFFALTDKSVFPYNEGNISSHIFITCNEDFL